MNTVGMFAGRGDVILMLGIMLLVGLYGGWKARALWEKIRRNG